MSNDIVGTRIGIYDILYECDYKTKCGHKVYHVKCSECGWEGDMAKSDAKRTSECRHKSMLNQEQIDAWYEKNKKQCLYCGEYIPLYDLGFNEYKERKFCDSSCSASYNNKKRSTVKENKEKQLKPKKYCKNCGKEIRSSNTFCSNECHNKFKYNAYIDDWKNGIVSGTKGYGVSLTIRKYLFEKYDNQCSQCGWGEINPTTGKIPLEVHHKDGDYTNNNENNLDLLCPNCHSLTPTYKGTNKGNGRKDRKNIILIR